LTICNYNVRLLVPTTFMNLSGKSVENMSKFYSINPEEILVAHDELDIKPGNVKLKFGGGHNGHNGIKDIISRLGNNNFHRLRIGIGRPDEKNIIKFVLNKPSFFDKKLINSVIYDAVRYTDIIIKDTIKAMSILHSLKKN